MHTTPHDTSIMHNGYRLVFVRWVMRESLEWSAQNVPRLHFGHP